MDTYAISSVDAEVFETFSNTYDAEREAAMLEDQGADVSRWRAVIEDDYLTRAERPGWRRVSEFA